ncbi:hypothetical protein H4219_002564 [Mycoemilia scoparia]|uniref:Uncharacterized protein n=1 Tax=Mycoemilia scoparia TaxID=417184 RepID=A0A9W8A6J4_9FUNG|nr:hypothetical protein H4219_002564 [Mycoemilia scoparia]
MGIDIGEALKFAAGNGTPESVHTTSFELPDVGFLKVIYIKLGAWSNVGYVLSIVSIVCSLLVIGTVLAHISHHGIRERPSFRLSASLAISDILCSVFQILVFQFPNIFSNASEKSIRGFIYMFQAGLVSFVYLTSCIVIQLILTVAMNKHWLARKISPWYEVVAWPLSMITASSSMVAFDHIKWLKAFNSLVFIDQTKQKMMTTIGGVYSINLFCILVCSITCIIICFKIWPVWSTSSKLRPAEGFNNSNVTTGTAIFNTIVGAEVTQSNNFVSRQNTVCNTKKRTDVITIVDPKYPYSNERSTDLSVTVIDAKSDIQYGQRKSISDVRLSSSHGTSSLFGSRNNRSSSCSNVHNRRTNKVRLAILRILLYPAIPAITQLPLIITLLSSHPASALTISAVVLPASQGIINFILFFMNPMFDPMWSKAVKKYRHYGFLGRGGTGSNPDVNEKQITENSVEISVDQLELPHVAATANTTKKGSAGGDLSNSLVGTSHTDFELTSSDSTDALSSQATKKQHRGWFSWIRTTSSSLWRSESTTKTGSPIHSAVEITSRRYTRGGIPTSTPSFYDASNSQQRFNTPPTTIFSPICRALSVPSEKIRRSIKRLSRKSNNSKRNSMIITPPSTSTNNVVISSPLNINGMIYPFSPKPANSGSVVARDTANTRHIDSVVISSHQINPIPIYRHQCPANFTANNTNGAATASIDSNDNPLATIIIARNNSIPQNRNNSSVKKKNINQQQQHLRQSLRPKFDPRTPWEYQDSLDTFCSSSLPVMNSNSFFNYYKRYSTGSVSTKSESIVL